MMCAQRAGDQFLSGSALATNQDRRIRVSHKSDQLPDFDHRVAVPQQFDRRGISFNDAWAPSF